MKRVWTSAVVVAMVMGAFLPAGCSKKSEPKEEPKKVSPRPAARTPPRNTPVTARQMDPPPRRVEPPVQPAATEAASSASMPAPDPEALARAQAAAAHAIKLANAPDMVAMRERFGLEVTRVRLVGEGRAIEVQIVVTAPEKAGAIVSPAAERYLIDQKTGTKIPAPPASRRARGLRAVPGSDAGRRTYTAVFDNSAGLVKPGDNVSLVMDEYQVANLPVQ